MRCELRSIVSVQKFATQLMSGTNVKTKLDFSLQMTYRSVNLIIYAGSKKEQWPLGTL